MISNVIDTITIVSFDTFGKAAESISGMHPYLDE
jgi:hypothetical protein